jgi:ABC-type uncharacterized transport system substrate-binding protein
MSDVRLWPKADMPKSMSLLGIKRTWVGALQMSAFDAVDGARSAASKCHRLQLLREVVPALSHVAMFVNSLNSFHVSSMKQARAAAQAMGIKLQLHDIRKSEDLDGAFAAVRKERPDALLILADRVFLHNRQHLIDFTKEQRLPNVNPYKELVEVGGLMSYGPSYEEHKRAAIYVDKILKGTKPADLPIEQPSKFTFIVNLKAAKALGVTVPSQLLGLADQLID